MAEQASSSQDKINSGSNTAFHSPSSSIVPMAGEPMNSLNSLEMAVCSNNPMMHPLCVDSADGSCVVASAPFLGLRHSAYHRKQRLEVAKSRPPAPSPPPSTSSIPSTSPILSVSSIPSVSTDRKSLFVSSMEEDEAARTKIIPYLSNKRREQLELPILRKQSLMSSSDFEKYDSLSSLSSSLCQLQQYSTYSLSDSIKNKYESSPHLDKIPQINTAKLKLPIKSELDTNITITDKKNDSDDKTSSYIKKDSSQARINICYSCQKKLPMINIKCKCGLYFCDKHRHAETHNCTFDYKTEKKNFLQKNITSVESDKLPKI